MPDNIQPQPLLVEIAIEPNSKADQERLGIALAGLTAEDPSFRASRDPESGQTVLKGTSESHLEGKIDILKRIHRIDAAIGAPQAALRERPTERVEHTFTHKRQSGGSGQFAAVSIVVEPNESGKGYAFESRIVGDALPTRYLSGVEKGLESVLASGVVAGFPVVDVRVALTDGKYHNIDSSTLTFEIATRACFREALIKAKSVLIEPIMKVNVVTPESYARSIIGDLNARRGNVQLQDRHGNDCIINATAPLMSLFGYASALQMISEGSAACTMQFDHYAAAPPFYTGNDPPFRPAIGMRA
jgi:elongation factor G